jgi:peptidoglycan/LPS O-acetylase OafA/YrhL
MSHPLYVLHWPLLVLALACLARLRGDWQGGPLLAVLLAGVLPLILAVSWLAHRFVERPMMDRGRRWIAARPGLAKRPRNTLPYSPS